MDRAPLHEFLSRKSAAPALDTQNAVLQQTKPELHLSRRSFLVFTSQNTLAALLPSSFVARAAPGLTSADEQLLEDLAPSISQASKKLPRKADPAYDRSTNSLTAPNQTARDISAIADAFVSPTALLAC
jgi:hypothetical protein